MADSAMSMLIGRQAAVLEAACKTNVDETDPSRAGLVTVNEFTDEPGKYGGIVLVCMDSHPADEDAWRSEMKDYKADLGFELPNDGRGFIGATRFKVFRGTVKVITRIEEAGQTVIDIRQAVLARAEQALQESTALTGFTDDFGVSVQFFNVARVLEFKQVGGDQVAYLDWAALATAPR